MNPKRAKRDFTAIKDSILKDGKVDAEEVDILLSFVEPYTRCYHRKFERLRYLLYKAKDSGKIENQEELKEAMDEAEDFLRMEYKIERYIGYLIGATLSILLFKYLIQ